MIDVLSSRFKSRIPYNLPKYFESNYDNFDIDSIKYLKVERNEEDYDEDGPKHVEEEVYMILSIDNKWKFITLSSFNWKDLEEEYAFEISLDGVDNFDVVLEEENRFVPFHNFVRRSKNKQLMYAYKKYKDYLKSLHGK